MFPPAPNEKKRGSGVVERIFCFLIGAGLGVAVALTVRYHFGFSPLVLGLIVFSFGILGLLIGKKICELVVPFFGL